MLKKFLLVVFASLLFATADFAQGNSTATGPTASPSPATKAKSTAFRPTKDQINQGQKMLKEAKLYNGDATGIYNDDTRAAVKAYQKANSLDENGKFDRATLEKMGIALTDKQKGIATTATSSTTKTQTIASTTATTDGPKRPAPFRASKDQISAAQKMLRDGKMLTGGDEGKLDDATRDSLGKYQEANGLKVTKTLNAATLEKMGIALTDKQKEQVAAQAAYDAGKAKN